jgi:hypothetical protein
MGSYDEDYPAKGRASWMESAWDMTPSGPDEPNRVCDPASPPMRPVEDRRCGRRPPTDR